MTRDNDIFTLTLPDDFGCLLFDSPHSGRVYPADFNHDIDRQSLQYREDRLVDVLIQSIPQHGVAMLAALFPATYVDANRAFDDIDADMFAGQWPYPLNPSHFGHKGVGVVKLHTMTPDGLRPIYTDKPQATAAAQRIEKYWQSYHEQIRTLLSLMAWHYGSAFLVDCHAMRSHDSKGIARPDFILGDRDGRGCDAGFIMAAANILTTMGYKVHINDQLKGVEIVRRYGQPEFNIHTFQMEINRNLYLAENTLEPHAGFARLQSDLTEFARELRHYCMLDARSKRPAIPPKPSGYTP